MDVRVGLYRYLSTKELMVLFFFYFYFFIFILFYFFELMVLNCGVGEDSGESLGQQGDPTSPS